MVLLVAMAAGWIYFIFIKDKPNNPNPTPTISVAPSKTTSPTPQATPVNNQIFELISASNFLNPIADKAKVFLFNTSDGFLKSLILPIKLGAETNLIPTKLENVIAITWSPNKNFVLVKFTSNDQIRHSVIDLKQNLSYTLPFYLTDFSWAPDEKKLAAYHSLPVKNEYFISTINPDGTGEQKLLDIRLKNIILSWPAQDNIIFWQKTAPGDTTEQIFSLSVKQKTLSEVPIPFYENGKAGASGLTALPAPGGQRVLINFSDSNSKSLISSIYNREAKVDPLKEMPLANALINLPFSTIPEKCSWAPGGENLYCTYSEEFINGKHVVPFGYWMGDFTTNDSFARFNWKTGEFKIYAEKTSFDATELSVSPDESFLVFINRKDMNLYKMKL